MAPFQPNAETDAVQLAIQGSYANADVTNGTTGRDPPNSGLFKIVSVGYRVKYSSLA